MGGTSLPGTTSSYSELLEGNSIKKKKANSQGQGYLVDSKLPEGLTVRSRSYTA